jgi:hypothetical protein
MSAIYSPLDPTHHETRIFILRLGKWDDEIHGTLRKVSLDEQPEYTALSYVWGDAKDTVKYGFLVALIRKHNWPSSNHHARIHLSFRSNNKVV